MKRYKPYELQYKDILTQQYLQIQEDILTKMVRKAWLGAIQKWRRNIEQPMVTQKDDKRWQGGTKGHQKKW